MDLSQFTTDDLKALQSGDLSKVSTAGLQALHAQSVASKAQADTADWQATVSPTSDMGAGSRVLASIGQGMSNVGNGVGQLIGKVLPEKGSTLGNAIRNGVSMLPGGNGLLDLEKSQAEIDQAKKTDAPLLATTAGKVGSVAGNVAAALPVALIPGANGYAGAAAVGGATGALQPVASDEGDFARLKNTAIGAAAGPVGVGIARGIGGVFQAGKALVQPLTQGGRDQIAGKVLARFAENPNAISGATSQPTITGAVPTLAEQTGDVGIARLQDALGSLDPQINNAISGRLAQNNAARVVKLNELAGETVTGNGGARDFAAANRAATTKPMYDEALGVVPDASSLTPEQSRSLATLMKSPAIQSAMKDAQTIAQNNGTNVGPSNASGSVEGLHNMKLAMDDQIAAATKAGNPNLAASIKSAQGKLVDYIESVSPEYANARTVYAQMSQPINSMDVAAQVAKRGLSNIDDLRTQVPNIKPNAFIGALKNEPQLIQQATGRNVGNKLSDVMAPQDETMLRTIGDEANRAAGVQAAGAGTGSPTAQRMASQNIVNALIGPLGTPGGVSEGWMKSLAESVLARNALARPLNFVYSGAEPDIQKTLAKAVLDPDTAKSVLLAAQKASIRLPPNLASRLTQVASGQLAEQDARNALTAP